MRRAPRRTERSAAKPGPEGDPGAGHAGAGAVPLTGAPFTLRAVRCRCRAKLIQAYRAHPLPGRRPASGRGAGGGPDRRALARASIACWHAQGAPIGRVHHCLEPAQRAAGPRMPTKRRTTARSRSFAERGTSGSCRTSASAPIRAGSRSRACSRSICHWPRRWSWPWPSVRTPSSWSSRRQPAELLLTELMPALAEISRSARGRAVPIRQSRVTMAASCVLAPALRAGRALGQTEVAQLGRAVVHHDRLARRQLQPELRQHGAWLTHHPAAIGARLVPIRRRPQQQARVAGAQGADDHIVRAGRVLDRPDRDAAGIDAELRLPPR